MGKKKGNSKDVWLDWLRDEPPAPTAQAELRERFKQQANSYTPVNRFQPQSSPTPQPSVAAPQAAHQAQPVSNTAQRQNHVSAAPGAAAPATVSIQIHLPNFQFKRLGKWIATAKHGIETTKAWAQHQLRTNKSRFIAITAASVIVLLGVFLPPLMHNGPEKDVSGTSNGASAGAAVTGYEKPPFQVVTPSSKTKLATPDGVHAAYDGQKNVYTFSDAISGNGFTLSQQPIPPQFSTGEAAVESIGPTLNKGVTPVALKVITGKAYLSTNPKYNSQSIVANVRDVLIFIQSSHAFKASEWENYLNTLQ